MPDSPNRAAIDRVDWMSVVPVLRLVSAFKHALQPGKLVVALLALLAIHFSGTVLDLIWSAASEDDSAGIYETMATQFGQMLHQLFDAALSLDLGVGSVSGGVLGSLYGIFIALPEWAFGEHPWFSLIFCIDVVFVLAMASGILTRMAATQVCAGKLTTLKSAASTVSNRWVWYLLTPLMPAVLIVLVSAVLALAGLVFFNLPGLDVAGSVIYGPLLLLGFVVAAVGLLLLFALFLMPPALSVEGSDGFDAIARSFNYILFRPWQFGVYLLASIVYLAVVYVLLALVASLSIDTAGHLIGLGIVSEHQPTEASEWGMERWRELVAAIVLAILFSTLCCLQTQVYVLLRRSADGTPMDQCEDSEQGDLWETPAEPASTDEPKAEG